MYERGETFSHFVTVRNYTSTDKENPDSIKITITAPDDVVLVNALGMTSDGATVGEYWYNYNIPADALYGEYAVEVDTVSGTSTTTERGHFIVIPWDIVDKIRTYSGVNKESVSDDDVATLAFEAYGELLEEAYIYHTYESPICDPDYCALFNGTNTVVRAKHTPIADHDFDGEVYGIGNVSRNTDYIDVAGFWLDSDYAKHEATITVNDSVTGRITITQSDGTAIPSTHTGVYIRYWSEWEMFNNRLLRDAAAYLASHNLLLKMTDAHTATAADLPSNQRKIEISLNRFERKCNQIMEKISKPLCEGV